MHMRQLGLADCVHTAVAPSYHVPDRRADHGDRGGGTTPATPQAAGGEISALPRPSCARPAPTPDSRSPRLATALCVCRSLYSGAALCDS